MLVAASAAFDVYDAGHADEAEEALLEWLRWRRRRGEASVSSGLVTRAEGLCSEPTGERRSEQVDIASSFAPETVAAALTRLWTVDGASLVPIEGAKTWECPITLEALKSPVLLGDGFVYEEAAIVRWLDSASGSGKSPLTNLPLPHRRTLKLAPLRTIIEEFLRNACDRSDGSVRPHAKREAVAVAAAVRLQRWWRRYRRAVMRRARRQRLTLQRRHIARPVHVPALAATVAQCVGPRRTLLHVGWNERFGGLLEQRSGESTNSTTPVVAVMETLEARRSRLRDELAAVEQEIELVAVTGSAAATFI